MNVQESPASATVPAPPIGGLGTGVGSLPHSDPTEAARIVLDQLPGLPFVPELPGRGPHAGLVGRGAALLTGIDVELTTTGWRIGTGTSLEHGRAVGTLAGDLDAFESVSGAWGHGLAAEAPRLLKTQVVGPLTLAACLELPGGAAGVGDPGARRDVAQSLADGVTGHLAELARRFGVPVLLQLDEPMLPAVLTGSIRRPSGIGRYRAPESDEVSGLLGGVLRTGAARTLVHCCADGFPVELVRHAGADAIGFDLDRVADPTLEQYAAAVESGASLVVGAIPAVRPGAEAGGPGTEAVRAGTDGESRSDRSPASRVLDWWRRLGFDDELAAERVAVTTTCGSAGADEQWAVRALGLAHEAATQLSP